MEIEQIDNKVIIKGQLTIYEVEELRQTLLTVMEEYDQIKIDMQKIDDCDSLGVQLLLSAQKTAVAQGKDLELINISPPINRIMKAIGFEVI